MRSRGSTSSQHRLPRRHAHASRASPLRDHRLRDERVDGRERRRPADARTRGGRAATRSSTSSCAAGHGSRSTASRWTRRRARLCSCGPGATAPLSRRRLARPCWRSAQVGKAYPAAGRSGRRSRLYRAGDYAGVVERAREPLEASAEPPTTSRAARASPGGREDAIRHLRTAFEAPAEPSEFARVDTDLDPIRDETGVPGARRLMSSYQLARIEEIEGVAYRQGTPLRPVRHHLGITAFGTNALDGCQQGRPADAGAWRTTRAVRSSTSSFAAARGSRSTATP